MSGAIPPLPKYAFMAWCFMLFFWTSPFQPCHVNTMNYELIRYVIFSVTLLHHLSSSGPNILLGTLFSIDFYPWSSVRNLVF
jgi:hypothetical protein